MSRRVYVVAFAPSVGRDGEEAGVGGFEWRTTWRAALDCFASFVDPKEHDGCDCA